MKKWFSLALSLLMLLGLTACGGEVSVKEKQQATTASEVNSIETAKAALEAGAYEQAYAYLITDESDEATELLKHLVFVPTKRIVEEHEEGETPTTYTTVYTYDASGNFLSLMETDQNGETVGRWDCTYDDQGWLLSSRDESGGIVRSYRGVPDEEGLTVELVESRNGEDYVDSRYRFNQENQLVSIAHRDERFSEIKKTYDERGNVVKIVYDLCSAVMTYDEQNRLSSIAVEDCRTIRKYWERKYIYDKTGKRLETYNLQEEDDAYSSKVFKSETITTYDEKGNKLSVIENHEKEEGPSHSETTYTYDAQGNCLTAEIVRSEPEDDQSVYGKQTYTYDDQGRLIKEEGIGPIWPNEFWLAHYQYTGNDYTMTYVYDAQGRVSNQTFDYSEKYEMVSGEIEEWSVTYDIEVAYDAAGNCTTTVSNTGTVFYKTVEDSYGRLLEEWRTKTVDEPQLCLFLSFEYDRFGNEIKRCISRGSTEITEWELNYYPTKSPYWFALGVYDPIREHCSIWPTDVYGVAEELANRLGEEPANVLGIEEDYFFLYGIA